MNNKPLTKEELDRVNEVVANTVAQIYLKIADAEPITEDEAALLTISAANGMFQNVIMEVVDESEQSLKDPVRRKTVEHMLGQLSKKFQARRLLLTLSLLNKFSEEQKQKVVDSLNGGTAPAKKKIIIKDE